MDNKIKKQMPKSALALYVKLFCKKKGNKTKTIQDNRVLIEATKSWLALNENDKQQFLKKYHEYQSNIKKAFANYLKTAEPYLKAKEPNKVKPNINIMKENTIEKNCDKEVEPHSVQDQNNLLNVDNTNTFLSPRDSSYCDTSMQLLENANNSIYMTENNKFSNVEPTPPKFITGKQLFIMLNNESYVSWTKLNTSQKGKYQKAVLTIKRKYLTNYQKYLEQLPSEKLFEHFKNCT
ncbi:uncharacterized protein LOC123656492 [Melitaea cinxia]|uniref:uncharacterized protein LOC123656492 n=1 Tax=Melitaea cinxia TaxID=113334 RepID=UPI001E273610|nr:uncharacterized protein LOC123656492 [Melitaea cinxia]